MSDSTPKHPGAILWEELNRRGIPVHKAAKALAVSNIFLTDVTSTHVAMSARLAVRLEAVGLGKAGDWCRLQREYTAWKKAGKDTQTIEEFSRTVKVRGFPTPKP